jgi:hypothetical protein
MRLRRIAAIPFALLADMVTLFNMGDRSFIQQLFDAERREQYDLEMREIAKLVIRILCAARDEAKARETAKAAPVGDASASQVAGSAAATVPNLD